MISGAEVAFFSIKPKDKKLLQEMNTKSSGRVLKILRNPERFLANILIGNNFVNVSIVIVSTFVSLRTFDFSTEPVLGFLIQVVVVTALILLVGEIIPKIYANHNAVKVSLRMSYPITVIGNILYPFSSLLLKSSSFINKKLTLKKIGISMDDLSEVVDMTTGVVTEDKKILKSIVKFSNIEVSDVMRPRLDVVAVEIGTSFPRLVQVINESGYSRIPVFTQSFDNLNGILYVKDLLPFLDKPEDFRWQELLRSCYYVPQTKKINALLQEFLRKKIHMAVVVDEYGGTEGIVTLEDVLEEIVGDITDESDEIESHFTRLDENNYLFNAKVLLNDFYKIVQAPEDIFDNMRGDADTIAGLILEVRGEIPHPNDIIIIKNFTFTITSADARKIKKVKVSINPPQENI
jgi:gliding motility-associated protein GldE